MEMTPENLHFAITGEDASEQEYIDKQGATQHFEVLQELGDCHASVGDYVQAQKCYEKAASAEPAGPFLSKRGCEESGI